MNYAGNLNAGTPSVNSGTLLGGFGTNGNEYPNGIVIGTPTGDNGVITPLSGGGVSITTAVNVGSGLPNPGVQIRDSGIFFYNSIAGENIPFVLFAGDTAELDFITDINGGGVVNSGQNGGLTVQQGNASDSLSSGSITVSLQDPYKDTNYSVSATQTSGAPTQPLWINSRTTSNFEVVVDSGASVCWMTIGQPFS